jgi:hypothetical protein
MTTAFERRMQRALAATDDTMARSPRVIWCFEPENMPAMIDLMIAQGSLSEADRPHCVHWSELKGDREATDEEIAKVVDTDEMLAAAGIRTLAADAWDALAQGMEVFDAFMQERLGGGLDPDERAEFEQLGIHRLDHPSPA